EYYCWLYYRGAWVF
nr:immunoglobulin light chain junction region [Macaca mulatta]